MAHKLVSNHAKSPMRKKYSDKIAPLPLLSQLALQTRCWGNPAYRREKVCKRDKMRRALSDMTPTTIGDFVVAVVLKPPEWATYS